MVNKYANPKTVLGFAYHFSGLTENDGHENDGRQDAKLQENKSFNSVQMFKPRTPYTVPTASYRRVLKSAN